MNFLSLALLVIFFYLCGTFAADDNPHGRPQSSLPNDSKSNSKSSEKPEYVRVKLKTLGTIQGLRSLGMDFFGGIPFASPPIGEYRFAPPQEVAKWKPHILDATQFGPDCYQLVDPVMNPLATPETMSEDCLYLNIYTPAGAAHSKRKLPVMVWFHGGAFQQGAAKRPEYDGRRLAKQDNVIVVTCNYRLGALGFLVSSELGLLGNYGLMDQRAALYWIQSHISNFGGNPDSITLFGESAGAVMIGLHLQMNNPGLFHRAILQSNPMGYQFRSVVVADFLGDALKRAVDCRDLQCLRSERVEEIMRAQSTLMGIPRSVGDFFTWGPTLTHQKHITVGAGAPNKALNLEYRSLFSVDSYAMQRESTKFAVNVSQPMANLHLVADDVPIIIGTNKHEGEMFVHSAFPITMSKAVYWMFVGALFKDSASKVLKHYRPYVEQLEKEARAIAEKQLLEEENKHYYMDHQEELEKEYQWLLSAHTKASPETVEQLVHTFSSGGGIDGTSDFASASAAVAGDDNNETIIAQQQQQHWWRPPLPKRLGSLDPELQEARRLEREEKRLQRKRQKALKEAAKVVIDYRPIMSRIINDYLFRCPSWHYAHLLSKNRVHKDINNVYVYRFSQPTHVPGYLECWGKSCHTSELPYVFQSMDVIRSNYSTLSPYAVAEAPSTPEYPYTEMLDAYRGVVEPKEKRTFENSTSTSHNWRNHTRSFQRILNHFFDDYFMEDADEETASDMSQRWVAFARSGDPNYEESKVEWIPWRYIPRESHHKNSQVGGVVEDEFDQFLPWEKQQYYEDMWNDLGLEEDETTTGDSGKENDDDDYKLGRAYRQRALQALNMEVVEEDELRSEMKRTKSNPNHDSDKSFLKFLSKLGVRKEGDSDKEIQLNTIRQVQRMAQYLGVLGTGLQNSVGGGGKQDDRHSYWDDDFFPQLLELKWPPEGRLVERDCTCDFWARIRYRY